VNPALRLTMVESRVRKSAFLREVIRQLDLSDADVLTQRIEAAASNPAVAGSVQLVSVRAVRLDASMWRTIDSLVSQDGGVLWFRTADESIEPSEAFRAESVLKTGTRHQVALLLRAHS
jgi:16S rRNA G527 N7-methylase RsmG